MLPLHLEIGRPPMPERRAVHAVVNAMAPVSASIRQSYTVLQPWLTFFWLQDFRTGYYTLASPKALFTAQIVGAFLGVLISPG